MKYLMIILLAFIISCDTILGTEDDVDVRIHITGFGESGGFNFQKGFVKNYSGPTIKRVKVDWVSSVSSGSVDVIPNVLAKDQQGNYYIRYSGSGLQTSINYEVK